MFYFSADGRQGVDPRPGGGLAQKSVGKNWKPNILLELIPWSILTEKVTEMAD